MTSETRRSDFIRSFLLSSKEKITLSNYVPPNRNSRGVVNDIVNRFEMKGGGGRVRKVPLAEMEDLKDNNVMTKEPKKRREYNKNNNRFLNTILNIASTSNEQMRSKDEKENIPKKTKNCKVADESSKSEATKNRPFRMKRTLTDSTNNYSTNAWKMVSAALGGPLKKRLSEGAATLIGGNNSSSGGGRGSTDTLHNQKKQKSAASSFFGTLIRLSSSSSLKDIGQVKVASTSSVASPSASSSTTPSSRSIHSAADNIQKKRIFGRSHTCDLTTTDRPLLTDDDHGFMNVSSPSLERLRPTTLAGTSVINSERKLIGRRGTMSRTMSLIPTTSPLPPLYEDETCSTKATVEEGTKRRLRKYVGSHTTSTYQGKKDSAPDASPRRHLIGFLHRTSHLSLTSELSGNASFYLIGHRRNVEESTIGSESDARIFSDDDDRGSTTTDFTSVSRQHEKMAKKRNKKKNFRKPSRASSFSSITESSMSLDVITVTLNMDTVNFLGISIVGQTSTRGDNGIYVANIMKGGAVALDGRIEAGDMILQVNETSFENFTNDQAVDVLREAVSRRGPIKLTVAKSFENAPQSCFTIPRNSREEPVRPIDTQAWIQHTNAMRGMPSIIEESAPTPIPGEWPHGRPQSSSTVTSGSNGQNTVVGGVPNGGGHIQLDIHTDKKKVVEVMAMPGSGLDIKNRTWLKIPIPMSFLGSDLVEWLLDHVEGLRERKDARKYAADLLKLKYIAHVVNKITFTEQCYYVLGDECSEYTRFRNEDGGPKYQWTNAMNGMSANGPMGSQGPLYGNKAMAPSMVSGYASMPVSPYPNPIKREDQKSQASGSSGASARMRSVILPSKPASIGSGGGNEDFHDMAVSRQSFRAAMNHPYEFLIDKI